MIKRMIALFLVIAMLVPLSSAVAADATSAPPTVEEILSEYHRKAFEAQTQTETNTASTWSRRGTEKTLEQETVDTLTEAGYEAYNVTADNYDTLEAELQTDFAGMGLNPEGSYIIVVHGEEQSGTNSNARNSDVPSYDQELEGGSNSLFEYTYNGVTYTMRYVTVTSTENSHLREVDDVRLNDALSPDNVLEIVDMSSSIVGYLSDLILVGEVATSVSLITTPISISMLLLGLLPDYSPKMTDLIRMTGKCNWTVKYTQIYDFDAQEWFLSAGVEYVVVQKYVDYEIQNPETDLLDKHTVYYDNETLYSALYNDPEAMKQRAVVAYEYGQGDNRHLDKVEKVEFTYGEDNKTVLTISRTIYDYIE